MIITTLINEFIQLHNYGQPGRKHVRLLKTEWAKAVIILTSLNKDIYKGYIYILELLLSGHTKSKPSLLSENIRSSVHYTGEQPYIKCSGEYQYIKDQVHVRKCTIVLEAKT